MPYHNCKKLFLFRKSTIILKSSDEEQMFLKVESYKLKNYEIF